jgi:arginase
MSIRVIEVPYHLAALRVGMGAGPEALIASGALEGISAHDVDRHTVIVPSEGVNENATCFMVDSAIAVAAARNRMAGDSLVVLAGNCHSCLGALAGIGPDAALIWFDAHADLNTPDTTPSGFFDGMALATAVGWTWRQLASTIPGFVVVDEPRVLLVGARQLDAEEATSLRNSAIRHYQPPSLRRDATTDRQWTQTLRNWNSRYRVYIHIDLDIIDPTQFDANDYSVSSGVSVEWLETAVSTIRRTFAVEGIGFTSYDPARDPERRAGQMVNRLIRAVLG